MSDPKSMADHPTPRVTDPGRGAVHLRGDSFARARSSICRRHDRDGGGALGGKQDYRLFSWRQGGVYKGIESRMRGDVGQRRGGIARQSKRVIVRNAGKTIKRRRGGECAIPGALSPGNAIDGRRRH